MSAKILIIDDHQIVFSGIDLLITVNKLNIELLYSADGKGYKEIIKNNPIDLIILDVNIPNVDAMQLLIDILETNPKQKILIYSMSPEEMYAKRFLKLGAMGYVSKGTSNVEFLEAINQALQGKKYISEGLKNIIVYESIYKKQSENLFERLSQREFEVMNLFLKGHGSKEISNLTGLHSSTIGTYKTKIFSKLGVSTILELKELADIYKMEG